MCYNVTCFVDNLPIVIIVLIVACSYYVYIYELCFLLIASETKRIIYLTCFHFFLIIFLAMYFFAMCHQDWEIPEKFYIPSSYLSLIYDSKSNQKEYNLLMSLCKERQIRVYMRTTNGSIRYCGDCGIVKPDRAHHCSKCETCILKMDHHCPWINNCVGFTNHKYFVILVLYAALYCTFYAATAMEYCVKFFTNIKAAQMRQVSVIILTLVTIGIGGTLWLLYFFHLHLIFSNETTLEAMHEPIFAGTNRLTFNRGCSENFRENCTLNPVYWCLPVNTISGNGTDFEVLEYADD